MKTVCIVTGSRAEYGLLKPLIEGIQKSPGLHLQLIATGMHLSPEFGLTVSSIESDGFRVDRKVETLLSSDTPVGTTKSMGLGLIGFADALAELKPDIMLVLGDRYEILAAVAAALIARIPVAHLHGGEVTEGAFDESIRHSITKMSHLHFVAAEEYRQRVIQLGELPERVFQVGALGVDNITQTQLLSRDELEKSLDWKLAPTNLLVTFHPVTLDDGTGELQMAELIAALSELKQTGLLFTMPNADTGGRNLVRQIQDFCSKNPLAVFFKSLGQQRYYSCIKHFDGVVGNSSSGLIEVPSFEKGTVNIGDRQKGRLKASSVIDSAPTRLNISHALQKLLSPAFQADLKNTINPYGKAGTCDSIIQILDDVQLDGILKKRFFDLPVRRH